MGRNYDPHITLGEDYLNKFDEIVVIGDIHGCCDEFEELLDRVHSESPSKDPNKTLKILVGDLVNKGPKNVEVLDTCVMTFPESIISVMGNHDELVHRRIVSAEWVTKMSDEYYNYLKNLPLTISIPSLNCIIVHAGLVPSSGDPRDDTSPELLKSMRNIIKTVDDVTNEVKYVGTKSITEGEPWASQWPGPQHVYFGHDARRRLQDTHEFATGLDTGCVYGDRLSYIYIKGERKGEIISIKAKGQYTPMTG